MRVFRLALVQMNPTVGDLEGNTAQVLDYMEQARSLGADLVAFPELAIPGYPPEDLLLKPQFIKDNLDCLQTVVRRSTGLAVVIGFVDLREDIYNAAAVIYDGKLIGVHHKNFLPNYGVFDEDRYFQAGRTADVYVIRGAKIGVNVCEDIWYPLGPAEIQAHSGAELVININGSPYHDGKRAYREKMLATRANDNTVYVAYVNMVGGQDELVFDGNSMVHNQSGELVVSGRAFEEDLVVADLDLEAVLRSRLHDPRRRKDWLLHRDGTARPPIVVSTEPPSVPKPPLPPREVPTLSRPAEIYAALRLATRDYVRKSGFKEVVVGLSGGIDSSLTAVIAVDALGPENVVGVRMPSRFTSEASLEDAQLLAENLGIRLHTVSIDSTFQSYLDTLEPLFRGTEWSSAEENIQARIRGNLLMALSNKFGYLVLTTGNKSELATGYATLYGDMAGGFAVLKDVFKTTVYELARFRNGLGPKPVIPERVFTKVPSAELRPGQTDFERLPRYEVLDPILRAYVEEDYSYQDILAMGFDENTVRQVIRMVDQSEYKRRQAPPGPKITPRAFGRDRRLPIVNRYRSF